ncbi:MAG: efflux RND transporter periplasmic adaptor subunit [Kordiimonadaceae bacterium]|nr:efflux RND transporter periplasmic adaptor subunit [Kordiimonadaceae bacterium]MBO6567656.1 efflux RND transporter periplasmic adaptor subunit [Kordiimonadaceae bacterium]MBO6963130.1 efflux RND transporter periplasmic adaptor subunit [Kordiimonadaceae bacterium]
MMNMKISNGRGITGLAAGIMLAALALPAVAQQQPPPALVEVAQASEELMAPKVFMPGTVVSQNDSQVSAQIAGQVTWVAPEGTMVSRGDLLAEIDDRNHRLAVDRNESQVKRLEARVAFLTSDLARQKELAETEFAPTSQVEEAESTLLMTEQELAQARIALEQSKIDLDRTKVRAPFPGRVVARLAQAGEYSTPGRQIVRLVDTENLEVRGQAPVNLAGLLRDGLPVALRKEGDQYDSSIRALVPVGDTVSRTMEIRVHVPANAGYVVGTALQIGVPSSAPSEVVAVPRDALVLRSEGTYVFRIKEDNTAERLLVRTGAASGARVAVVGGIESGDRVVIRGGERLRPGQPVQFEGVESSR